MVHIVHTQIAQAILAIQVLKQVGQLSDFVGEQSAAIITFTINVASRVLECIV